MAMTLVEAAKLSNDRLLVGVIETIITESGLLQQLPFIEVVGNGLTYNQELTLPSAHFYDVNEDWAESTPTFRQQTAVLKIMGGDADVDNFLKATRSDINDLEGTVVELKAKAVKNLFEETFIYGDVTTNPKHFDGLCYLLSLLTEDVAVPGDANYTGQVIRAVTDAVSASLTLTMLDELIDAVKGGKPDALIMNKKMRRKIKDLTRAAGYNLETDRNEFGMYIEIVNGVPIIIDDYILNTHLCTAADCGEIADFTSGDSTVIFAVQFGEGALAGITAPGHLTVEPIGSLEGKDATRTRVKWYTSLALFTIVKAAALIGVTD